MRLRHISIAVFAVCAWIVTPAANAADLYDNLDQPLSVDGNFSAGSWPALSFKTSMTSYILDSVTIPVRNPNLLNSGTISFLLYDSTGPFRTPGAAIGTALGSIPIADISGASYQNVTFSGLNRTLSPDANYWVAVQGVGISSVYYVGATTSSGGTVAGSYGFSITNDAGSTWSVPNTTLYVIGRVTAIPEPSTYALGMIAALVAGWVGRGKRRI